MEIEKFVLLGFVLMLAIGVALLPIWPWNRKPLQTWIAHAYYGMGKVTLDRMTRTRAIEYVTKNFGVVTFVDDEHGFIFYKPRSEIK